MEGFMNDGTTMSMEQIRHHPPVTGFYVVGPEKSYRYSGTCSYKITCSLNSMRVKNFHLKYTKNFLGQKYWKEKNCVSRWSNH